MTFQKETRGQLVVEFVLGISVWALILVGMLSLFRFIILHQRVEQFSRFGMLLASNGNVADDVIRDELENYAAQLSVSSKEKWSWSVNRFLDTPASRFYRMMVMKARCDAEPLLKILPQPWVIEEKAVAQKESSL